MNMEMRESHKPPAAPKSESLWDEAVSFGSKAAHAAQDYVEHHKVAAAVEGLAVAGAVLALSRGRDAKGAATIAEGALSTLSRAKLALPVLTLGALGLAGCDQEKTTKAEVYKSADDCAKAGVFTDSFCKTEYGEALATHNQTVPKYQDKKDCEDKTGLACSVDSAGNPQSSVGHSSFIYYRPYMSGYMISRDQERAGTSGQGYRGVATPLYSTPEGGSGFVTSHGDEVAKSVGTTEVSERTVNTASKATSRSGESGEHSTTSAGEAEGAFARSPGSVSRGGFGGEGGEGGAHGVGGEAGGAHGGGGGAHGGGGGE